MRSPGHDHLARVGAQRARDELADGALTRAHEPDEGQDLALRHAQRDVSSAAARQAAELDGVLGGRRGEVELEARQRASDDELDDPLRARLADGEVGDPEAVAQDDDSAGETRDLAQAVRNWNPALIARARARAAAP